MLAPSKEWIVERLADYKACRSHREIAAIESMLAEYAREQVEARERALREALLAQALAHDYAGEPCFCGDDARNPPLTPEHIPSCLQARAALAPRPRHEGKESIDG